jgi:hypothetical protein
MLIKLRGFGDQDDILEGLLEEARPVPKCSRHHQCVDIVEVGGVAPRLFQVVDFERDVWWCAWTNQLEVLSLIRHMEILQERLYRG